MSAEFDNLFVTDEELERARRQIARRRPKPTGQPIRAQQPPKPKQHKRPQAAPVVASQGVWQPRGYADFSTASLIAWVAALWVLCLCALGFSIWSALETFTYAGVAFPNEHILLRLTFSLLVQFGAQPLFFMANYTADPVTAWAMRAVAVALNVLDMGTNINGYSLLLADNPPPALPNVPVLGNSFFPYVGYGLAMIATFAEEGMTVALSGALHFTSVAMGDFQMTPPEWMRIKDRS